MMWRILLSVFSLLVFSGDASDTPTQIFNRLMQNYNRNEAPGFPNNPTEVKLGMYVVNLDVVGDKTSAFTLTFYLRQKWDDPRLKFSSADGKMPNIRLPENSWNQVWLPDTFIRKSLSVKIADDLSSNRVLLLNSDGGVWYALKLSAVVQCGFDLHRYPFDQQECELNFESFGYRTDTLRFASLPQPIDIGSDLTLSQFRIVNSSTADCSNNYTSGGYTCLKMAFVLKRNITHFFLQFYLPSIIFVILSWLTFWIDPESSSASRLLTGILPLLALVLLNSLAGHSSFFVDYATSLDSWVLVCYVFVSATLVEYAVVSVLSKKPSGARGLDYLKPPFAGSEKTIEAQNVKPGDGSSGDGKRKARLVDWFSMICFPVVFLLFNLIYWIANASVKNKAAR